MYLGYDDEVSQAWLYWSNVEAYASCPQKFLWGHGWPGIDLGRGPGRSKEKPGKDSRHHAIMGLVLATAIERLYNDELWRDPVKLPSVLATLVDREFKLTMADPRNYVDWSKSPPKDELLRVCQDGAQGYLRTMKANKLLGPYAKAEVDITTWLDKYTPIAGRPDVIIRREDTGITILDGKNGLTPGKYTDPDQLRWYALCFYLAYGTIPNHLVFCYFRYPVGCPPEGHDPSVPWTGLVEVPFTEDDLKVVATKAKETYRAMNKTLFDPTPSPQACKFCEYESVCEARTQQKAQNRRTPKKSPTEDLLGDGGGIVELGFVPATRLSGKKA